MKLFDFPFFRFPLYSRSSIPTKAVKYAVNLLNQNIAQLCYDITGIRVDVRATIENILLILEVFSEIEQTKRDIHSHNMLHMPRKRLTIHEMNNSAPNTQDGKNFNHASVKNGKDYASLSKSHSSVDMDHMLPPTVHPHHHLQHNVTGFPLTSENIRLSTHLGTQPIDIQQERNEMLNNQQR